MTLHVAVGSAQALDGREAGLQATHLALNNLGSATPGFGIVIASHQYQAREIVSGVSSLLGDTPMIGFSSTAVFNIYGFTFQLCSGRVISWRFPGRDAMDAQLRTRRARDRCSTCKTTYRKGGRVRSFSLLMVSMGMLTNSALPYRISPFLSQVDFPLATCIRVIPTR